MVKYASKNRDKETVLNYLVTTGMTREQAEVEYTKMSQKKRRKILKELV